MERHEHHPIAPSSYPDRGFAVLVALALTGEPWQYEVLLRGAVPEPTPAQVTAYTVANWLGLALISVVGLLWLWSLVRRSCREMPTPSRVYRVRTGPLAGSV